MFASEFIAWGDTADNVVLTAVDVAPESEMALPDQTDPVTVLQATYSIASWGGFSHDMTTNRDWSAYDALQFWMYGTNTGATVQVEIHDDPNSDVEGDSAERFYYRITDDFEGWKQFTIPFGSFVRRTDWQPAGAMDDGLTLTNVAGYSFGLPTGTEEQTLYFAQIEVVQGDFAAEPEVTVEPTATPEPVIETAPLNAPYRNPNLPVEDRVNDLLSRMTLDEKIGQVTLVDKNSINPDDITLLSIGGLLSGGGGYPDTENTPEAWAEMVDGFQMYALQSRLGIPVIYGVDAVHGHNNVRGAVIFPHNIGMGATGDPDLVEQVCHATAEEMIATGIYWDYAPVVAVPQDIRWGRLYEGYSENTDLVTQLATACVSGLQGENLGDPGSVLATPKHYVGDGGAVWGTSTTNDYQIDQGVTDVDEATLRAIHLPPYVAVIDNGAMNIMISFSSWGGIKMHGQDYLINDVMKGELGFTGFTVSDWAGIDQLPGDYYSDVVTSINAGVDMVMVPYDYLLFIQTLRQAVDNGDISEERIDDAVRRILRVKFELGLFEWGFSDPRMLETVGSETHRALARQAVAESAVLLQNNDQTLPLAKDTPTIFVAGQAADDIGMQSGGWTIEWQGNTGEITDGTTILDGIEAAVSGDVYYDEAGEFADATDASGNPLTADVGIVVVGEIPYAEGIGDRADLTLSAEDQALIEQVRARSSKLVIVLVSGRPLVVTDQLRLSDAFVAAWLPGTEGQGVADVLFGDMPFTGKLSYTWPRSNEQLPFDFANLSTEGCDAPLFPFGYGLDTTTTQTLVIEDCP
jgi:beta-glucosidase